MARQFNKYGTTSKGKFQSIAWQLERILPRTSDKIEYIVGLPGRYTQANRHVKQYRAMGYKQDKQIMVDWNIDVCKGLWNWQKRTGYKGLIICASIEDVVRYLNGEKLNPLYNTKQLGLIRLDKLMTKNGGKVKVGTVDADGTLQLGKWCRGLVRVCKKYQVRNLILCGYARGQSNELKDFARKAGYRRKVDRHSRKRYILKEVGPAYLKCVARKTVELCLYRGYGPMFQTVINF